MFLYLVTYTTTVVGFWAVSLMMEDYEFAWQTTPMYISLYPKNVFDKYEFLYRSVVPLQFLVQVYTVSSTCTVGKLVFSINTNSRYHDYRS